MTGVLAQPPGGASWLGAEAAKLASSRPRVARCLRFLLARQVSVCLVVGALSGAWSAATLRLLDSELFAHAARQLLSPHGLHVFADDRLQVGPLHLLLLSPFALIASITGLDPVAVTGAGAGMILAAAVQLVLVRCQVAGVRRMGCTLSFLLLGPLAASAGYGHAEEVLVGLCLLTAGLLAGSARGSAVWPALWVGVATDLKLWGALGVCILLIRVDWRSLQLRAVTFVAVVAAAYLPFFLAGDVHTGDFAWRVSRIAPASLVLPVGTSFGWRERVLQGLLVVLIGAVVARTSRHPGWMTPAAVVLARLATDPLAYSYYWTALITVALIALWASELADGWLMASAAALPLACALPFWSPSLSLTLVEGSLLVAAVACCPKPLVDQGITQSDDGPGAVRST